MKYSLALFILIAVMSCKFKKEEAFISQDRLKEDFELLIDDISNNYVYLNDKNLDFDCIKETYRSQLNELQSKEEIILFFEQLLDEFYDTHMHLTTNVKGSYRLSSPLYVKIMENKAYIKNIWQSHLESIAPNLIGAQIISVNDIPINTLIEDYRTLCLDKTDSKVRNWIVNKVVAGKRDMPRKLKLLTIKGIETILDMDELRLQEKKELVSFEVKDNTGIIRVNDALGDNGLIADFDDALDSVFGTENLIIDLRNTASGGNTYVATGIMGRFVNKPVFYQRHEHIPSVIDGAPAVTSTWIDGISPRGKFYDKPVIILVGRWTGSMGEGMAIGFEGINRAEIVGTEMARLAGGSDRNYSFKHLYFGYQIMNQKLYHLNGTPRENYVPTNYVKQTNTTTDKTLEAAIKILGKN